MAESYSSYLKDILRKICSADAGAFVAEGETVVIDTGSERVALSRKNGVLTVAPFSGTGIETKGLRVK